ncbi:uncharacterized protein [Asterias amurensis]|uniref:uncharacterized protein n=1 Tax=Asterias amurensis TaxID=7602 RepID=UPI003AB60A83
MFNTMDGRISMYVLLVCVWCSLDAGGFLMVVTAQPTVYAEILTPEADRKEGGQVDMRCTATNLESDHIVEWRTGNPDRTLRWGESNVDNNNGRFIFDTSVGVNTRTVVQDFVITNVQRADTGQYVCSVKNPIPTGGGYNTIARSSVTLSVLYLASMTPKNIEVSTTMTAPFSTPLVVAFIVLAVTIFVVVIIHVVILIFRVRQKRLIKRLRSEKENQVTQADPYMELQLTEDENRIYMEPTTTVGNIPTQDTYCQVPVEVENESPEYDYARPDYLKEQSSSGATDTQVDNESQKDDYLQPRPHYLKEQRINHKVRVHVDATLSSSGVTDTQVDNGSQEDDYLQPRPHDLKEQRINHQASVHVDPTSSSPGVTDTQHTYFQPDKVDNGSQEDDYAQPDDPKEHKINHQVSVHVNPTPSSSGATGTQHTYFQPDKVDNGSQEDDYAQPDDPKEQKINHQVSVHVDPTPSSSGATDTQHTYFQQLK